MDLLSDEIPPKFYEWLGRQILSKVGDRFVYGMDCWMWHGEKKIGKMDPLALPYTRTMVSSSITRSTCLLNCLCPSWPKFIKFQLYLIKSIYNFGILIHLPTNLPTS